MSTPCSFEGCPEDWTGAMSQIKYNKDVFNIPLCEKHQKEVEELRYSVKEIEKIFEWLVDGKPYEWDTAYFVEFLKDSKRVEEILK